VVLEHSKVEGHSSRDCKLQFASTQQTTGWMKQIECIITLVVANNHQMGDYWTTKTPHNLEWLQIVIFNFNQPDNNWTDKREWLYFASNSKSNGMLTTYTKDIISKGQKSVLGWKHLFFPLKVDCRRETSLFFFLKRRF